MNAGIPTYATQKPCQAPITAPSTRQRITASGHGMSHLVIMIAATAPVNAATDPTDRSMCRAMMTITMPIARIRIEAFWVNRLVRFSGRSRMPSVGDLEQHHDGHERDDHAVLPDVAAQHVLQGVHRATS